MEQVAGTIIYDSLCITNRQYYAQATGASCGGEDVFGEASDLQSANDFTLLTGSLISETVTDYITFTGECPPSVCVQFYAAVGCTPSELPTGGVTLEPTCQRYSDSIFGLEGVRIFAPIHGAVSLPAGRWFVSVQPRSSADWFYQNMAYCPPPCGDCACSAVVRDGGADNPCCDGEGGFGNPDWAPYSGEQWTTSMRITVGPLEPAACCFEGQVCEDILPSECYERGGRAFLEESCLGFDCPLKGACCHDDGRCVTEIEQDCADHEGVWFAGSDCATFECQPFGACCLDDGDCLYVPAERCVEVDGAWHSGENCSTFDCVRMGVCCIGEFCSNMREVECEEIGGDFTYGTQCDDFRCPARGACCVGDADCRFEFEDDCLALGGTFVGERIPCNLQCHAEHVRRLRAKCSAEGRINVKLIFKDHSADGNAALIRIDADVYNAGVVDRRAKLIVGPYGGAHTVGVVDPPSDLTVDVLCPP